MRSTRVKTILAIALVLSLAVAGCAENEKPATTRATPPPVVITSVDDMASLSNQTFTNESHFHDYWGGKTTLVILDQKRDGTTFFISPDWSVPFLADVDQVVPQGTSQVTVTATWTSEGTDTYSSPELWVRMAQDHESHKVAALEPGKPVVIPTTLVDADVPHQRLSAWKFEFHIHPGPTGLIWFNGVVTLHVEATRGLEIPLYPPHPDAWRGRESLALFEDKVPMTGFYQGDPLTGNANCYNQCPRVHRPVNGSIVPYDASLVEVKLTKLSPSASQPGLAFHGADGRAWKKLTPAKSEGDVRTYVIPVTPLMGDGPYAAQSLWEFAPFIEGPVADGVQLGPYSISARVIH